MAYLTYAEFTAYGGDTSKISEAAFTLLEFRARKRIDYWTASRVQSMEEIPEDVKLCEMSLIKLEDSIGVEKQATDPVATSYTTDGYSESYGGIPTSVSDVDTTMGAVIRQMLYGVKDDHGVELLYRGLDKHETV